MSVPGYSGTGITSGPFALSLNTPVVVGDPRTGGTLSTSVQVQNASGFALTILSGTDYYTMTSYQSSTIPCPPGGAGITVTPITQSGISATPTMTLVWLLDGQDPPQPDGPLQLDSGISVVAQILGPETLTQGSPTYSLSIPLPSFTTSIGLTGTFTVAGPGANCYYSVTGNSTSTVYIREYVAESLPISAAAVISGDTAVTFALSAHFIGGLGSVGFSGELTAYGSGGAQVINFAGLPVDVTAYGGLQTVSAAGVNANSSTLVLAFPAAGTCYRVHAATIFGTAGQVFGLQIGHNGAFFCYIDSGSVTGQTVDLAGRLINAAIYVKAGSTDTIDYEVGYDVVTLPTIT